LFALCGQHKASDWRRQKMLFLPDTWLSSFYKLILLFNIGTDKAGVDQRNATLSPPQYPGRNYDGGHRGQFLYKGRWWPILGDVGRPEIRYNGAGQPDIGASPSSGEGLCQLPTYTDGQLPWDTKPYTILVEGTVGCGKSTLVNLLAPLHGLMAVPEPVDQWTNLNGTDMLDLLFQDPRRWMGAFQLESTLTRIKDAIRKPMVNGRPALVRVMERSLYSERFCFMEYAKQQENGMTETEFNLVDLWHKFAMEKFESKIKPDLIIFIQTTVETVEQRIKKRGRPEEQNIDMNFVDGINRLHEDWLLYQNSSFPVPAPVVVMNGTLGMEDFKRYVKDEILEKIIPADLRPYVIGN